ncbi:hypothetical protein LINPERHAP1_LOCUS17798 [Linum perenne]
MVISLLFIFRTSILPSKLLIIVILLRLGLLVVAMA